MLELTKGIAGVGRRDVARLSRFASGNRGRILYAALVVLGSPAATLWFALSRGQDSNWDQQNYHLGIAFLLAHGTFWDSVAPAGGQSYFNPYVIQAQFWAMQQIGPKDFAACLACLQAPAFMLSGLICAQIVRPVSQNLVLALLGFALCLAAPVSLSEAGTTFIDLVTAVPVLAAYAILLANCTNVRQRTIVCIAAGSLLGAATALKLTNAVFALAAAGLTLATGARLRERMRETLLVWGAALLGFLAVGGWWYATIWSRFGNPFFPYYNDIFHSPDFRRVEIHDTRFLPRSILDIWRYPTYWLLGGTPDPRTATPSTEVAFIDARWVFSIFGTTVFLAWRLARAMRARTSSSGPLPGLLCAFAVGYVLWLFEFGIHRYLIPLDILCGAAILLIVARTPVIRYKPAVLLSVLVVALLVIHVPDWAHRPWSQRWEPDTAISVHLPPRSLVFLTDRPSLVIALSLPPDTRYADITGIPDLNASNDTGLTRHLRSILSERPAVEVEYRRSLSRPAAVVLQSYGLAPTKRCRLLTSADRQLRICDVVPMHGPKPDRG